MNKTILIGNLTQDPEERHTSSDTIVARLRLAVSRPRRDGEDQGADYVDVTVFGNQAQNCLKYLAKGRKVAVDGHLHHSEWESDTGRWQKLEVVAHQVEFLGAPAATSNNDEPEPVPAGVATGDTEDPEDIPF